MNDIFIYNKIRKKKYIEHVRLILHRLQELNLFVKTFKCEFFKPELSFLRFQCEKDEINMKKTELRQFKNDSSQNRSKIFNVFVKFINFYKCFIKNYLFIASSFLDYLKTSKIKKKSKKES